MHDKIHAFWLLALSLSKRCYESVRYNINKLTSIYSS